MNSKSSMIGPIAVAVAFYGGVAGVAHADGNSLSRFGGDGYAYFNEQRPIVDKARSEFRRDNPKGLPESHYQGLSSWGPEWHLAPEISKSGAKFRQGNLSGIPFSEYQPSHRTHRGGNRRDQCSPGDAAPRRDAIFTRSGNERAFIFRIILPR